MSSPGNTAFFVRGDDGEEYGPVGLAELREWVRENRAGLGTEVRGENEENWQPWQNYPELVALLAEAQAGGTLPGAFIIAPMTRRVLAFGLDLFLITVLFLPILVAGWIVLFPASFEQKFTAAQQYIFYGTSYDDSVPEPVETMENLIFYIVATAYLAGFLRAHGQTPGKALLRLRVVDQNGRKPGLLRAITRGLVIVLSLSLLGLPFFAVFLNTQRRALHDLMAGTCVVEN